MKDKRGCIDISTPVSLVDVVLNAPPPLSCSLVLVVVGNIAGGRRGACADLGSRNGHGGEGGTALHHGGEHALYMTSLIQAIQNFLLKQNRDVMALCRPFSLFFRCVNPPAGIYG